MARNRKPSRIEQLVLYVVALFGAIFVLVLLSWPLLNAFNYLK